MSKPFDLIDHPFNPMDGKIFKAGSESELLLTPATDCTRFSLRITLTNLTIASKAFGLEIPSNIGGMNSNENTSALCLGPDEWMLLAPESAQQTIQDSFDQIDKGVNYSLVDIGHRTVGISVSGSAATQVMNSGCPLDLDKMPDGSCTRSIFDKAQILIIKYHEKSYRLEIVRSFAEYVWNYLSIAGSEVGSSNSLK